MSEDFGNGVSRTLSALQRQFQLVVWQANKPPLDSELNLIAQISNDQLASAIRSEMHSGWMLDPFAADTDFETDVDWSNFFKFGRVEASAEAPVLWANVNGWIVPVLGTNVTDTSNRLNLFPPPGSDSRIDFVFLEVWQAQVAPNPSEVNKPSASTLYRYGNVEYGGTNIPDDIEDPAIGVETTERVQLQYRLRVVGRGTGLGDSVDLASFPDGLDDPNVVAQGTATDPVAGFTYTNMRDELGDPGLWRAGNGDATNALGTVDGYSYAVPVCAVFRRNSASFVSRTNGGNANQNGGFNRNPRTASITDPVEGTRTFTPITLTNDIGADTTGAVQVDGLAGSGFDNVDLDWTSTFLVIDDEVIGIDSVDTGTTPGTITIRTTGGRGRNGTQARPHLAGASIQFFNFRPDEKFSDQIHAEDILDLRKGVTPGQWDYQALLSHNLGKLFENTLKSSYKQAAGSDTEGPVIVEVDTLWANGAFAVPNQTTALDGPDGIRTVFSDASVIESDVTVLLKPSDSGSSPTAITDYTSGASTWEVAADFAPDGFQPDSGGWTNGAVINLFIGGATGTGGARATVRTSADANMVRFISPREYWLTRDEIDVATPGIGAHGLQTPFRFRLIENDWGEPPGADQPAAGHPGPMFPLPEHNFERPFIVLGGVVNSALRIEAGVDTLASSSVPSGLSVVRFPGVDFDTAGNWYATGDLAGLDTDGITNLLLHGARNLFDMLTNGGNDRTGASSELYLVLTGDTSNAPNSGVFRVIGAGTVGYTTESGLAATDLVVERVGLDSGGAASGVVTTTGITAEVRSQYTHTEDGSVAADGAAAVLVMTDLNGVGAGTEFPWSGLLTLPATSEAVLDTTVLYGPSRGGTARVANHIDRVAMVGVDSAELVREAPTGLDPDFDDEAGVPEGELYFPTQHVQTWNRLPSLGLSGPWAPGYGAGSYLADQRREAEVFVDAGSKTLMLRPYRRTDLVLWRNQLTDGASNRLFPSTYTQGVSTGIAIDGANIFTPDADYAYAFPHEFMPRFGRQDIPVHQTTGAAGPVYFGVNHLFGDSQTDSDEVFRVIGGHPSTSDVLSLFVQTGTPSGLVYGEYGGATVGYQGRIYSDVNVSSTDLPSKGLKGIQLPPFLGIARLYGVYDRREFLGQGSWDSDRVTENTTSGRPTNLLKRDADKQTLFIVPGGAEDVTGNEDDHTYVVPSDLIDVTLSGQYVAGETFDDLDYVVECVVFGFGRGFINKNNYIMARLNLPTQSGSGLDGTAVPALGNDLSCILPLPLPFNEQLYATYSRTAYQGDPYMTRDGGTRTVSDYTNRYGQIPQDGAVQLATPIQQYDSTTDFSQVPEIPNARSLEILASMDFWTTLGTGKVGGPVYAGTALDIGHITNRGVAPTRIPAEGSDPIWQSEARSYTQGAAENAPRGTLTLTVLQTATASAGESITFTRNDVTYTLVSNSDFNDLPGTTIADTAKNLAAAINSNTEIRGAAGVQAYWNGGATVELVSLIPGAEGNETRLAILPATGSRTPAGFSLTSTSVTYGLAPTSSLMIGGSTPAMNATLNGRARSPLRMTGLTERLPMGILLQDADFIGEDPLRNGSSPLQLHMGGGSDAPTGDAPILGDSEYGRIQGAGYIGQADGSILQYTPWSLTVTSGTRKFRLFRGGGSAYVLDPTPEGGPVGFSAGGLSDGDDPVVKGAVLAGRAFLVRNYEEEAFSATSTRSYGDELQMVIVTSGHVGSGPQCGHGYALDGQISPTGWGEGFVASDRYRLEGKPLVAGHNEVAPDPNIELAPFPSEDDADPDPCA
jgi:hypothetical protein